MYIKYFKRLFDLVFSILFILIFSPLFLIVSVLIKIDSKGPILFKQERVGKNKKPFNIYKFRSMKIDAPKDSPTHLLNNSEFYITKLGKFLRSSSLDELPQLFNILFNDMSIVGPRPCLFNQEDLIFERDKYGVNDVKPGLTGLAQISGRDELEISVKAKYDGEYVKNCSFMYDLKILFLTFFKVIKKEGIKEGK